MAGSTAERPISTVVVVSARAARRTGSVSPTATARARCAFSIAARRPRVMTAFRTAPRPRSIAAARALHVLPVSMADAPRRRARISSATGSRPTSTVAAGARRARWDRPAAERPTARRVSVSTAGVELAARRRSSSATACASTLEPTARTAVCAAPPARPTASAPTASARWSVSAARSCAPARVSTRPPTRLTAARATCRACPARSASAVGACLRARWDRSRAAAGACRRNEIHSTAVAATCRARRAHRASAECASRRVNHRCSRATAARSVSTRASTRTTAACVASRVRRRLTPPLPARTRPASSERVSRASKTVTGPFRMAAKPSCWSLHSTAAAAIDRAQRRSRAPVASVAGLYPWASTS